MFRREFHLNFDIKVMRLVAKTHEIDHATKSIKLYVHVFTVTYGTGTVTIIKANLILT